MSIYNKYIYKNVKQSKKKNSSKSIKTLKDNVKTVKKLVPVAIKQLGFKNPSDPNQIYFVYRYQGNFTREEVREFAQDKSNKIKEQVSDSKLFSVSLQFEGSDIYRSGKRTEPGEPINLWDPEDSNEVDDWDITGFDILVTIPRDEKKKVDKITTSKSKDKTFKPTPIDLKIIKPKTPKKMFSKNLKKK